MKDVVMGGLINTLAGNTNHALAEAVAAYLGEPLTKCHVRRFADMEVFVEILENVRGRDTFILQSTSFPTNDHLMELLIMTDALRRASARRITAVIPYFGYARQDRKPGPRTPISAKLVANLVTRAGADRVMTLDLHAGQIQGFFDIPEKEILDVWVKEKAGNPLYYFGRQGTMIDPRLQSEDLGDNAMKAGAYGIANLKRILPNIET